MADGAQNHPRYFQARWAPAGAVRRQCRPGTERAPFNAGQRPRRSRVARLRPAPQATLRRKKTNSATGRMRAKLASPLICNGFLRFLMVSFASAGPAFDLTQGIIIAEPVLK